MNVNSKKPLVLRNPTCYFDRDKDKVKVRVSSPCSYQSRVSKIEGYENRLYWQFRYCQEHDGQTFFYTLTYNNRNIPNHYGVNCFDYDDLRELLTGGFRKILLRKYGTIFKYFVGAELGDGKGKRGFHNNPHYHFLFFLEPAFPVLPSCPRVNDDDEVVYKAIMDIRPYKRSDAMNRFVVAYRKRKKDWKGVFPYQKISPEDFRHLIRLYWQGFDQDDVRVDFRDAAHGIACEGLNCGLVYDYKACMYVAKYVCKDAKLIDKEPDIKKVLTMRYTKDLRYKEETYKGFLMEYMNEHHRSDVLKTFRNIIPEFVQQYEKQNNCSFRLFEQGNLFVDSKVSVENFSNFQYQPFVLALIRKKGLWHRFYDYLNRQVEPLVKKGIDEWRNRFSNKCRISQGVGLFALEHIEDINAPTVQVPSKDGFKNRPIGLYYYRKLYCDIMKDEKGSNIYYLNEKGIEYKSHNLQRRCEKLLSKVSGYFDILLQDRELYSVMYSSDINTDVTFSYDGFIRQYNKVLSNYQLYDVLSRYAIYKLVYQDRFFSYQIQRGSGIADFPCISPRRDYEYFLLPSPYFLVRNDLLLADFLENTPENYLPYSQHPYFLPFICLFSVLDMCTDYFFIQNDDKKQREAEERARVKRFHDKRKLIDKFQSLNLF